MQRTFTMVVALFLVTANSSPGRAQNPLQPNVHQQEIERAMERLRLASFLSEPNSRNERAADRATLELMLATDFVRVTPEGTFLTKAEVLGADDDSETVVILHDRMKVFTFGDKTALAVCLAHVTGRRWSGDEVIARVFLKRGDTWKLVAEEGQRRPEGRSSKPFTMNAEAARNPALPRHARDEAEVRALVEQQRLAADPRAQNPFRRPFDWNGILAAMADNYVRVAGDRDLSVQTKEDHRKQFVEAARRNAAIDAAHQWANDPAASLEYENVNVAILDDTAVVTWRSVINGNRRAPNYTVFRVYQKIGEQWRMLASVH